MEPLRFYTRDLAELDQVISLFPRDCVRCDSTSQLSCPSCAEGQACQFTVPTDCSECAQAVCVDAPDASGDSSSDSSQDGSGGGKDGGGGGGPNAGAIAGGVVGGVVVLALLTYLAWRFLIKPKRSEEAARQSAYSGRATNPTESSEKDGALRLTRRSSTHTVHSIASTVLTRASNIIQIAYIPGVTNRAHNQSSGGMLVPPVPPIPMEHAGSGSNSPANDDQHFFVPGDLRDSTYSGLSGYSDRASYATHASYAPRSSIASTIYGKQAQVMTPASTGMRAKPTMVSVKSLGVSNGNAPPVPDVDYDKFGANRPQSVASNFSVGSTFLNTATQTRAQVVKVGGGLRQVQIAGKSDSSAKTAGTGSSSDSNSDTGASSDSESTTPTGPKPALPKLTINNSPFLDPADDAVSPTAPPTKSGSNVGLGAVVEEAEDEEDAGGDGKDKRPTSTERGPSPFGDEHATK
ncbi:hypothetical protein GMORB2_2603 [Geosmithia morbida]|uniref:Membrane anchor Opy2 N-terminal domain-containing protein n=1 Tax=Geosmithia morbida TaxID=1094350 RepID=A0A9P4YQ81_9HYPO|nr:uncharacterized protein GMORB2_2603 [Geosmithia morbida]KAF4121116.1 hypothetical protein GMORB2_2603 [Geosmithia morbida]